MKFYDDKVYVKMCEKAVEIQPRISPVLSLGEDIFFIKDFVWYQNPKNGTLFQIFRQDQLQEMIWDYIGFPLGIIEELDKNCNIITTQFVVDDYYKNFKSMEQLILAYLMERKFNKTWNGEEWI